MPEQTEELINALHDTDVIDGPSDRDRRDKTDGLLGLPGQQGRFTFRGEIPGLILRYALARFGTDQVCDQIRFLNLLEQLMKRLATPMKAIILAPHLALLRPLHLARQPP